MKNIDDGPIYNGRLRIRKRENIKEEKSNKKDKKLIESKEKLPEGHIDFDNINKEWTDFQIRIENFNKEAQDLIEKDMEEIKSVSEKCQIKYNKISEEFNESTKKLMEEFDSKRKELEKLIEKNDISKYTDKMRKLYEEMQPKWDKCRQEYSENEKKAKEQQLKEIKKINTEYNSKILELKKKYKLK